jgi:alpha-glucosidase
MSMNVNWWRSAVIYQVYPRSFRDASGDGVGDLEGIIQKLDYLSHDLGVDAIWISPFYRSPMADFGYDVSDHTAVEPLFGDLETAERLIDACHQRNLRIILDYVPNHTANVHPWFRKSASDRSNAKRQWYIWKNPKSDGGPPNNWLSIFGGSAWQWHEETGQYYLHRFLSEQPDLNWRNPEVVEAMHDVLRFWLDRGVDGFRIDAPITLMRDPDFRDNPPRQARPDGWAQGWWTHNAEFDEQEHVFDERHPDLHGIFRGIRSVLDRYPPAGSRVAIAEVEPRPWRDWIQYYGQDHDEVQLPFNFELLVAPWTPAATKEVVDGLEDALPDGCWPNYTLGNHDHPRLASRLGPAQRRIAAMLLLTLRGTPTLYYGDELGLEDITVSPEEQQDPYGRRVPGQGRDGCRSPMPWSSDPGGGFTRPDAIPWLPFQPDATSLCVAQQQADPRSLWSLYQRLLALRRANATLQMGAYEPMDSRHDQVLCYRRFDDEGSFVIALNYASETQQVTIPDGITGRVVLSTCLDTAGPVDTQALRLRAHEGVVIRCDPHV